MTTRSLSKNSSSDRERAKRPLARSDDDSIYTEITVEEERRSPAVVAAGRIQRSFWTGSYSCYAFFVSPLAKIEAT